VVVAALALVVLWAPGVAGSGSAGAPRVTGAPPPPDEPVDPDASIEIVVFHGDGCPYCARLLDFLGELQQREPLLRVTAHEVWNDGANRELFRATAAQYGFEPTAVPTTFLGDAWWVGFDSTVQRQIEDVVTALAAGRAPEAHERTSVDVPFVGEVDVGHSSLVTATILIAFVDGVNPCSFWVLSMLLALTLHSGSRKRIAVVGAVFLTVTSALYGLYMFGAYSALAYADGVTWIRLAVAIVAGTFGVLHLKEYVTHRGPALTIPDGRKPAMYRRMRGLARSDRSWAAVIGGTAVLAVGVSLAETPCTAGLPLLWTNLVSARDVPASGAALLFALYLLVFLIDELVVFGIAVVTLRAAKLQEHHGRALQLVSGTLMVALAVAMIAAPAMLETVSGTAALFTVSGAVVAVVLVGAHVVGRRRGAGDPAHRGGGARGERVLPRGARPRAPMPHGRAR
jgi:cytochrome c biogenesis protein CcdA/glutaredoxin